jgi:hypothetical protein
LVSIPELDKVSLVADFSKGVNAKGLQAGKFIGNIAKICGGGGGEGSGDSVPLKPQLVARILGHKGGLFIMSDDFNRAVFIRSC